jgi:hypothetical protein
MTLTVQHVPQQFVAQTWPLVEEHIASANKYGGDDYTLDQIKMYATQGQWVLLVATDEEKKVHGAATVSFLNYPNDRVAFVTSIGGKLISNDDTFEQLKVLLRSMGATKIQGAAREAIARLWKRYGFAERYVVVEVKI